MEAPCTTRSPSAAASIASSNASIAATTTANCWRAARWFHRAEDVVDVGGWRAEIRRQARADKITVRTGVDDGLVWALRLRREQAEQRTEMRRYQRLVSRVAPLAAGLRHEPSVMLRDGDEVICAGDRCSALGYGDTTEDIAGGALFEDECPSEEPPKLTALSIMFVAGSSRPTWH